MNRTIRLFEKDSIKDTSSIKTNGMRGEAWITNNATGEVIFRKNKIILPGSVTVATKLFDVTPSITLPNYNDTLGLDNRTSQSPDVPEKCYLFAVGTDGCGSESSQVYDVDYTKWISPEALVPFRYQESDLSPELRQKYFGRKDLGTGFIAYYFKAFDQDPVIEERYVDGTAIDSNIYSSSNDTEVETYVELKFTITKEDCRDFFIETTGITTANISSISLLTGWPQEIGGNIYYQNIQPLTKLNIPRESLQDLSKGLNIVYHIYF